MASPIERRSVANDLPVNGLITIIWVGVALGILFASVRMYIRLKRMRSLLADDYLVLIALAFLIANAILMTLQAPHLYYTALTPTGPDIRFHGTMYVRYEFVIIGIFWSVLWSIKGSFLALYWMIAGSLPRYRWVWIGVTTFTVLSYIACWLLSALNCHPPSDYFKFGKCTKPIDQRSAALTISFSTVVDIVTDIMIMSIGVHIIWGTSLSTRQKIGIGVIFCIGVLIIVAAIVRAIEISDKAYTDIVGVGVWSVAESSISMIVGCLPPFKELVAQFSGSSRDAASRDNTANRPGGFSRIKNVSGSEVPLPLDEHRLCHQTEYELHPRHVDGRGLSSSRESGSEDGRPGAVREFVSPTPILGPSSLD